MFMEDDRTELEKRTHPVVVVGTDPFLSGWGKAEGGVSYAGWACTVSDHYTVDRWVRRRDDMKRVRTVGSDYRPKGTGHCHIYVVNPGHVALR